MANTENAPYIALPPGYIVLTRDEYDDLIEQRVSNRIDYAERLHELEVESMSWHNKYLDETMRAGKAIMERDDAKKREDDLAFKLHEANDTIIQLRAEIHLLNDELCRTDELWKGVSNALPEG